MSSDGLFSEAAINGLVLKNRFVRSATWEGMANEDGGVTEGLILLYEELARNEIGLIITGHTYIREDGKATPRQLGIYKDSLISGLKRLAKRVHSLGGKVILQLSHSGIFGRRIISKGKPVNPSRIAKRDIDALIQDFSLSATRAKEAGFDGVQLHAAHGYLISQFFSPIFNKRDDEYGGNLRNRARFAERIVKAIRDNLGPDFPILIKMNCDDFRAGGLTLRESLDIAKILVNEGVNAVEVSGGLLTSKDSGPCRTYEGPYFLKEAMYFKRELSVPVILVGGIRSYEASERIINEGIDFVSMSRPFICEPGLIKRWKMGDREKSACISDNKCLGVVKSNEGVSCFRRHIGDT